ncbi:MAG: penicillin-binding protein [Solirubrobacterales bacterium]|nr:penicillin-binding protein [Solirubrobacterales bacterium]MCB8970811.1 penicillin-binding protein [Thermoleophilales bacterium]MCO5327679.1 penicillin-binding protein [Solirubrobacterales bacterium]
MLIGAGLVSMLLMAAGGVTIWALNVMADAPDIDTLHPIDDGANTKVYAADGSSLGYVQSDILRTPVKLKEIPLGLQQATISIEDEHFYEHGGVDYGAIVRAALKNAESGEVEQGASTITQQLVRNLYIEDPKDTIERKLKEADMAMQYEKEYSKKQILNQYLNTATYGTTDGRSAVGVEAASEVFFNKNVKDLGLKEQALLAGLPQAPTDYNPFINPKGATERRNQVLDAMADQGYITQDKADKAKAQGLGLERGTRYEQRKQQFFFDFVQDELIEKYGLKTVRQGGLKVYTTLQPDLQAAAEQAIVAHPVSEAANALVSIDSHTGEILAMASSSSYDSSQFNLAAQGTRQPGSSFKPFVLTTAVDQGIDPDSTYYNGSSTTLYPPGAPPWQVASDGSGSASLREATAQSMNSVFAALGLDVGPENFADMAHKMGITSELQGFPAEAIGGTAYCCTVLEMADAYATLSNGGVHHDPTAIDRVVFPDGHVDKPDDPEGDRVISDGVAYEVADVMKGPLDYGTAACCDIPCPAAGKTGTTEEQSDAWFVGFTPEVSTAVWTGNPNQRIPLPGYGADLSAPIWQDYMNAVIDRGGPLGKCDEFPTPTDPVSLSPFKSGQTSSSSDGDTTTDDGTAPTTPDTGNNGDTADVPPGTDADGDGYPDDQYAPGAGAPPADTK